MKIIRPKKIKSGDLIGIVAPSREISDFRSEVLAGLDILKNLGFRIKLGKTFNKGYYLSAGKSLERAKDFETMVADREVKAIFCALGGDATNQTLDLIDFELLKRNPKIIIGKIVGRKKSSQPLEELILTLTSDKNYPIVKVDYFGHRVKNFYPLPVGIDFSIDTKSKTIKTLEPILDD